MKDRAFSRVGQKIPGSHPSGRFNAEQVAADLCEVVFDAISILNESIVGNGKCVRMSASSVAYCCVCAVASSG